MSVSIALLPVALAMRVVMGKENFDNWAKAQEIQVETHFKTELALSRAIKKAGYNVTKLGSLLKTHLDESTFCLWEYRNNQWSAIFSKHDSDEKISRFYDFVHLVTETTQTERNRYSDNQIDTFPTNFCDGKLLFDTLSEFGVAPTLHSDGAVSCLINGTKLIFSQSGNAPYQVEVINAPDLQEIYRYLSDIDEDYKRCVQTVVYEKLKARAAEHNLSIESEEVLADKTILITLTI